MNYINLYPLLSRPSLFKMALSMRSDGKTTGAKTAGLQTHDDTGKAAVFCRRWDTEMTQPFLDTFFQNIKTAHPEMLRGRRYEMRGSRRKGFSAWITDRADTKCEGDMQKCFEFVPLSRAGRLKSNIDWETHKNIYIDEYIPLDGRYVYDECVVILELYKTVDREHFDNYLLITGNRVSRFNPVFDLFGIEKWKWGMNSYQDGRFDLLMNRDRENARAADNSPFGELVRGTKMAEYNAGEFLATDGDALIYSGHHAKLPLLLIARKRRLFALYAGAGLCVVCPIEKAASAPCACPCVAVDADDVADGRGVIWIKAERAKNVRKMLQERKYTNTLFFDSPQTYHLLQDFYAAI